MSLVALLRGAGASLIILALFHAVLWRALNWEREIERLSALNARVFVVHTLVVVFVLLAMGLLSLARPDLLIIRSELARLLLVGIVFFWAMRLLMQPVVFDPVMQEKWTRSALVRIGATLLFAGYVVIYGLALFRQFGSD